MNSQGEFTGSGAGDFVQSLLLERNRAGRTVRTLYFCPGFARWPDGTDEQFYIALNSFGEDPYFWKFEVPNDEHLFIANWAVQGGGGQIMGQVPATGGWYRGYFHFRGVCEAVPSEDFDARDDDPTAKPYGVPLGIQATGLVSAYSPQVTTLRGYGESFTAPLYGSLATSPAFNRILGQPNWNLYYFDRIIGCSFPGNGSLITAVASNFGWSANPTAVWNEFQGGSPPGRYFSTDQNYDPGVLVNRSGLVSSYFKKRNYHGHAKSLYSNNNIITQAQLDQANTTIEFYQFAETQFLGFFPETGWRTEDLIELEEPRIVPPP